MSLAALAREAGVPPVALRGPVAAALLTRAGLRSVMVGGARIIGAEDIPLARRLLAELAGELSQSPNGEDRVPYRKAITPPRADDGCVCPRRAAPWASR